MNEEQEKLARKDVQYDALKGTSLSNISNILMLYF
jgi:hypothetical protein